MSYRQRKNRLKRADFKGWKYDKIIDLPYTSKVLEAYPHLKKYPELNPKKFLTKSVSFDKTLRYILIYYSDNILRKTIPEVMQRKKEAALLAGFQLNKEGKFHVQVEKILLCQNQHANRMIVRVLRRSENKKFLQLCVFEESLAKQMQKLIDGIGEKDRELTKVVIDNVRTLTEDCEKLENDLLNEDEDKDLLNMLYDERDDNNLGISPEEIAELYNQEKLDSLIKAPYRSKYSAKGKSV